MAPNWFIAFPMQVERLHLPPTPPRVRSFGAEDLHVTLGFLGAVSEPQARVAWRRIDGFETFREVSGSFAEIRPLGNPRKPSAISAIVGQGFDAMSEMISEARGPLLAAAEAAPDDRPPLPHMTLARIQRRAGRDDRLAALKWAESVDLRGVSFTAGSIALYTWSRDRQARLFDIVERHSF